VPTYVVRVWLPDRPGALGAVASRIGSVRGDLVGIDILERGAGRAIDELVVDLPEPELVPLLVREISEVEGVDVEDIRPIGAHLVDPRLDALDAAIALVEARSTEQLVKVLAERAALDFEADWSVVMVLEGPTMLARSGKGPDAAWLGAFVNGSRASLAVGGDLGTVDDVAWANLGASDITLVLGRKGRPLRARERRQATSLARIADARWVELMTRR
jgi:hypothetical protein